MTEAPRGVKIPLLIEQVRNTAPYLWTHPTYSDLPCAQNLLIAAEKPNAEISHTHYFKLCVSAHWATAATYVPTDVDNQIRFKLWHPTLDKETILEMTSIVLAAQKWAIQSLSRRWQENELGVLSGHNGEWFSIAVAACRALEKRDTELSQFICETIRQEVQRESDFFDLCFESRNGIETLKAATTIAHNLGDLKRVIDMWNTPDRHPLALIYEAALKNPTLQFAGDLNRDYMAVDNHRHFALRKARCLRRFPELLIEIGPFLDQWGRKVANHAQLSPSEVGGVAEALIDGWVYLEGAPGYARALAGMESAWGINRLTDNLPVKMANFLKTGKLRAQCAVEQSRFDAKHQTLPYRIRPGFRKTFASLSIPTHC